MWISIARLSEFSQKLFILKQNKEIVKLLEKGSGFGNLMSTTNQPNIVMDSGFPATVDPRQVYSWSEINQLHKVRHGIYQRGGRLISLLTDFGKINRCYPDIHGETTDTIFYTGAGRRGDQPLNSFNQAMFNAVESKHAVPLFNKLSTGHWNFLGFWKVIEGKNIYDEMQKRMVWKFTLEKSSEK